jgi:hypothetical protein
VFDREHAFMGQLLNLRYRVDRGGRAFEQRFRPRAALVGEAVIEADAARQLALLRGGGLDPTTTVLLDAPAAPPPGVASGAMRPGAAEGARLLVSLPERVEVETNAAAPRHLVLADQHYPGWRATIDGVETPIRLANAVTRAVAVPAGTHQVVFTYRPWPLYFGAGVSVLTLAGLLVSRRRWL